ncbi:hypothetical protein KP509_30G011600 [Ceratopteris richardii]|uniref:DUF3527 domain protein n=1 Tax=Ceratopteris richardii TaxID=49495 RepID=A0A8T2R0Z9_CERRI|nr:hypothetical protein KP509_30G011600 [Ceratopteris richardii]
MPTLRVELLKSRDEDDHRNVVFDKRTMHSNRWGYAAHVSSMSKRTPGVEGKQVMERVRMGKVLRISQKLSMSGVNRSLPASCKVQSYHSPSESDSFSIRSSSSSCKSEADSIKKPSPPTLTEKATPTTMHTNLGSFLGRTRDTDHRLTYPRDLRVATSGELDRGDALQNAYLELRFAEDKMYCELQEADEKQSIYLDSVNSLRDLSSEKHDRSSTGASRRGTSGPLASAMAKPSENARQRKDTYNVPFLRAHEVRQSKIIKELPVANQRNLHQTIDDSPWSAVDSANLDLLLAGSPLKNLLNSGYAERKLSCKEIQMTKPSGTFTSMDPSARRGAIFSQRKPVPVKPSLEQYAFGAEFLSNNRHEQSDFTTESSASFFYHMHSDDLQLGRLDREHIAKKALAQEIKRGKTPPEKFPVSPLSLSDAGTQNACKDGYGIECLSDIALHAPYSNRALQTHPCKYHREWRSKSIGAKASLKSAVRNLESALGGARSVSLPKSRPGTEKKPSESFSFIDRVFVSPARSRHKLTDALSNSHQRTGSPQDLACSAMEKRGHVGSRRYTQESADKNYGLSPRNLPMLNTQTSLKTEFSESKAYSATMTLPQTSSVREVTALKEPSSHTRFLSPPSNCLSNGRVFPAPCVQQGFLQRFESGGNTCYTLCLKDSEEMLYAKASTSAHDSDKEDCECIYTFQSAKGKGRGKGSHGWKSWLKKEGKLISDRSGRMKVSTEFCSEVSSTGRRVQFLVSEFVLYNEQNHDPARSQSLRFLPISNSRRDSYMSDATPPSARSAYEFSQSAALLRKPLTSTPHSPSIRRMSSRWANVSHQPWQYGPFKNRKPVHQSSCSIDAWSDTDFGVPEVQQGEFCSTLSSELLAIVVKVPMEVIYESNGIFKTASCRRSLKFTDDNQDSKVSGMYGKDESMHAGTLNSATLVDDKQGSVHASGICPPSLGCVTMLLPKDQHGIPKDGLHGPKSLIDRWRQGGQCDCGGWDLGCPISVFSNQRRFEIHEETSNHRNMQNFPDKQPFRLYSEAKTQNVLLSVSLVQEGYFILKFQDSLEPLKAFATAVAILHSKELSLSTTREEVPAVMSNDQQCSDTCMASGSDDNPACLQDKIDIHSWYPSNVHSLSPYGRA